MGQLQEVHLRRRPRPWLPQRTTMGKSRVLSVPKLLHYSTLSCDPSDHLQESPGPPGPKSPKSLQRSLLEGPQKSPRKYPMTWYPPLILGILTCLAFSGTVLRTPQETRFETILGFGRPEGLETPVNGRSGRKPYLWTINFGRRNVKITSQKSSWNHFLALQFLQGIWLWCLCCSFWQLGPLGESISGAAKYLLHLRNRKRINSVMVSGQMVSSSY